jgi:hypothetical protein
MSQQKYSSAQEALADQSDNNTTEQQYCSLPETPARVFEEGVGPRRQELILSLETKWTNKTVLHYYFFDRETDGTKVGNRFVTWVGDETQKAVVRRGFQAWKEVGIGIEFKEVDNREEAEIRIGFMRDDGSWSALGREILREEPNKRTMNFGWSLTRRPQELDTAIHEIGHTLGFPHEHQNPRAGIVWNEETVYAELAGGLNRWPRETTFYNIIRKLPDSELAGSTWDPDSVMHYPFKAGLIREPQAYASGLTPAGGISATDKEQVKLFYPPDQPESDELKISQSVILNLSEGEQRNFTILPQETRYYRFQTFGTSDTVMALFEDDNGELRYRTADDDSGEDRNAFFRIKLIRGRRYVLRIRLYYAERSGETSVMMW